MIERERIKEIEIVIIERESTSMIARRAIPTEKKSLR